MEKYSPGYLGKVIPANDTSKMKTFVTEKYDAFTKIYDVVKDSSKNISDIKPVESSDGNSSSLSVKISTDQKTMEQISENTKKDESMNVNGDVITAK